LSEIRTAESEIKNIKQNNKISDYTTVLPTNSWESYKHLFIKIFDVDEFRLVDYFYVSCELAEKQINLYKNYETIATQEKIKEIQHKLLELADKYREGEKIENNEDYKEHKNQILEIFHNEAYWFQPHTSLRKTIGYIENIEFILSSSAGIKFKKKAKL